MINLYSLHVRTLLKLQLSGNGTSFPKLQQYLINHGLNHMHVYRDEGLVYRDQLTKFAWGSRMSIQQNVWSFMYSTDHAKLIRDFFKILASD